MHIDEATEYQNARWIGSQEACWRFLQYKIGNSKPPCQRLQIHLPDLQIVRFQENQLISNVLELPSTRFTTLTEWFTLNQNANLSEAREETVDLKNDPRSILYGDIPEKYVWKNYIWCLRKQGETIGRMYFINPRAGDLFYLRMFLLHVSGATSFDNLRTVNGELLS